MSKLDWMYKNDNTVDPEEYLLGKAIDKNFEAQQGSYRNEVDKDILPTSIFANSSSNVPVDVVRKIKEDPLEQIRQKEMEVRKQLLKNPVKLKKLQNMLKAKEEKKLREEEKKKKKKKNKDADIDSILAEKYSKLIQKFGTKKLAELTKSDDSDDEKNCRSKKSHSKNWSNQSESDSESASVEESSRRKKRRDGPELYDKVSRVEKRKEKGRRRSRSHSTERDKTSSKHSKSRKFDRRGRESGESCERSSPETQSKRNRKKDDSRGMMDEYMRLIQKHGTKKIMELISDESDEEERNKNKKTKARDGFEREKDRQKKSRSPSRVGSERGKRRSSSKTTEKIGRHSEHDRMRRKGPKHARQRSSSSSHSSDTDEDRAKNVKISEASHKRHRAADSSDEDRSASQKTFGLVFPKGVTSKTSSHSRSTVDSTVKTASAPPSKYVKPSIKKLTDEEKANKLKEMMSNGKWRDEERRNNVSRYREEEKREAANQKYDESFMRKELAKAVDSSKSVEERIKSRMNNVQRSKFSMNQNFARRT